MTNLISWERALLRMGFVFEKRGKTLLFYRENRDNQLLLEEMMQFLGIKDHLHDCVFTPPATEVEEEVFRNAFYRCRRSHDHFPGEVKSIKLHALDPYIAGIVRWCASIGIKTAMSCDGHGKRSASLYFNHEEDYYAVILDACLSLISHGRWQFKHHYQASGGHLLIRHSTKEMRHNTELRESRFNQDWLLDVAEELYRNQDHLREVVQSMKVVIRTNRNEKGVGIYE